MKLSEYFLPTLKTTPREAEIISHKLMLRTGMIRQVASGIYEYLPLGMKVLKKIEQIIREEMDNIGGQEVFLPALQPRELWDETGRWALYGEELMRIKDRKKREFCLGPTHEEIITDLVRKEVRSYKQLPFILYQFQNKFRDEIRPRFGIMRAREFYMKDAYSFDINEEEALKTYQKVFQSYEKIFSRCEFNFRAVEAESGYIGGNISHEFMVLASTGEEKILACKCGFGVNQEKYSSEFCPHCGEKLIQYNGIEIGHTFYLGTKYSKPMNAFYSDEKGEKKLIVMGCYGIGVSRIIAAAIEQNHDEDGIIWPFSLSPFEIIVIPLNFQDKDILKKAWKMYNNLKSEGIDVLIDDRELSAGEKFKDADLLGIPFQAIIGKHSVKEEKIELKFRKDKITDFISFEKLKEIINSHRSEIQKSKLKGQNYNSKFKI